jgi:acetyltransferase-like isoleucine patch superfamily enzyme
MNVRMLRRKFLNGAIAVFRRASISIRFLGRSVTAHPSAWISLRSVIRVNCGGSISIGKNCEIHPFSMLLTHGGDIHIGDNCSVNPYTIIYGCGGAYIGNSVRIAAHVMIVPENHNPGTDEVPLYQSGTTRKGIRIDDNVWIGAGVKILDGVSIGRNAVIGAGSVVTRSIPANATAAGVPARIVGTRTAAISAADEAS